ncbi:MAG: hypothetical protein J6U05_06860, partial [Neisseriaceae bacterium]|nr:hypothetical protein [Neisseriaceae bacterium]
MLFFRLPESTSRAGNSSLRESRRRSFVIIFRLPENLNKSLSVGRRPTLPKEYFMQTVLTTDAMRHAEQAAVARGTSLLQLMENAGQGAANAWLQA